MRERRSKECGGMGISEKIPVNEGRKRECECRQEIANIRRM